MGNQTLFSGSNLAVMKSSKTPEASVGGFWRTLMSREVQVKYSLFSGMLPARVDAFILIRSLLAVAHYADFLEQIKLGGTIPWCQLRGTGERGTFSEAYRASDDCKCQAQR